MALKALVYANELERDGLAKIRPDIWMRAFKDAWAFTEAMLFKSNPGLMLPVSWLCLSALIRVFRRRKNRISGQTATLRMFLETEPGLIPSKPWGLDFRALMKTGDELIDNMLV